MSVAERLRPSDSEIWVSKPIFARFSLSNSNSLTIYFHSMPTASIHCLTAQLHNDV
jgi:hypothetical protein